MQQRCYTRWRIFVRIIVYYIVFVTAIGIVRWTLRECRVATMETCGFCPFLSNSDHFDTPNYEHSFKIPPSILVCIPQENQSLSGDLTLTEYPTAPIHIQIFVWKICFPPLRRWRFPSFIRPSGNYFFSLKFDNFFTTNNIINV